MPALADVAGLLRNLHEADSRLQDVMRDLLQRYFQFLKSGPKGVFKTTRWLRMRLERDRDKRIRRISWTQRTQATLTVNGKIRHCTRRLRGEYTRDWVYNIAKDWARVATYDAFEEERKSLNSLRSEILTNRMRIRRSFEIRWATPANDQDLAESARTVAQNEPHLKGRDTRPLAGVLAYQRALDSAMMALGLTVTEWRKVFDHSVTVHFEPALRPNDDGSLRLYWGFPQRVGTPEGIRTYTDYIAGGPTDKFLRKLRIPARTRKEVGAFVKKIRTLERTYRDLVGQVGRHRKRVHELLSRVARLTTPRGSGGLLADTRTQHAAGVGMPPKEAM